ncbi:Predicted metalloprotease, contains C-terminal PDZ domain [Salegentibacter holothuriorum]|uniref:Predicted metalloprotease, contains C-terminal PDZ domain n=1 Tax=Salegentibacter holothuriorum TaxID=241145 RepID=A0A1T5AMU3_9FLAO|nr:peptidase M61 [Salegentibacter holothuriorum]SKB36334.1 Predicted metalloprotease, contains C-terminal PDZ domain [Salegentibacter holothuriorum]
MKKAIYTLAFIGTLYSCKTTQTQKEDQPVIASIDLVNIDEDKVSVNIDPDRFTTKNTTFYIPKTVPGTYSTDNYGKFIENFKAIAYDGSELEFEKLDDNSWFVSNAKELDKVSYQVNDTYDIEGEEGVFSPSGTNIEAGKNFMLNLHGFVGYFENEKEEAYRLLVKRPQGLIPGTALSKTVTASTSMEFKEDIYSLDRYFEVIDNPIMYAKPDTTSFMVEGMEVLINVYSPNKKYTSESIKPGIEEMIIAQKRFLGEVDNTGKYAILLYLSDSETQDARGFGALEHHTSTVVVLPEAMQPEQLQKTMTDVVSHEFFHILTPLNVHSKEVHYFDYNDPKMSQHLWMYEGVTEYFANLFQINQELIEKQDFYDRISEKIKSAQQFDDTMPFTEMSKNILEEPYKKSYYNVYQKGALIGMALDIRLRELSDGKMGILDLMKALSDKYGMDKPFTDDQLFEDIIALTYPEIRTFLETYISGSTPIPYREFFEKVGLEESEIQVNTGYFIKGQTPYIDGDPASKELFFRENIEFNSFLKKLGVKGGDIIKSVNEEKYNILNVYNLIMTAESWKEGEKVNFVVMRDGEKLELSTTASQPTDSELTLTEKDLPESSEEVKLRNAWLKG